MLDFRPTKGNATNYLGRREQRHLLLWVLLVGAAVLVGLQFSRHLNWSSLLNRGALANAPSPQCIPSGQSDGDGISEEIDTRLRPQAMPDSELGTFVSERKPEPTNIDRDRFFSGVRPELLGTVRDDTVFRPAETEAWFHLLAILSETKPAELSKHSTGGVGYRELFHQPNEYRGQLVTIRGNVRGLHRVEAPGNRQGISDYYQLWIQPAGGRASPIVVYCLELPKGFPQSRTDLLEGVELTGFFFKRWAYRAQDTVRTAPLVLAATVNWNRPAPVSTMPSPRVFTALVAGAGLFAAAITWIVYQRTRRRLPDAKTTLDWQSIATAEIDGVKEPTGTV